jgi:glutamate-1-semialdehyde 2,1-aminomutase
MFERAQNVLAGGVNGDIKYWEPYPIFLSSANGSRVKDVDGNEYIDYVLSYGALILGHGHRVIRDAISELVESYGTTLFGNPSPLEVEFGQLLLDTYMKDGRVRFTNSGLEATLLAVRLAKAFTGKTKIAKFDGHYHGANPFLLSNYKIEGAKKDSQRTEKKPDSPEVTGHLLEELVVLPFNDIEGSKKILEAEGSRLAAVILEPFEDGYIPADKEFMSFLRSYTEEKGILLIFDEVKTGFRVRVGGAAEYYRVKPDIACLGKVIGGGVPVGAVIGTSDIMDLLNPKTKTGRHVFHSGTFNGNPLSMTLGMATVKEITSNGNFDRLKGLSDELRAGISTVLSEFGVDHQLYGEGGIVNYTLGEKRIKTRRDLPYELLKARKDIDSLLLKEGVYVIPGSRLSLSLAHTEVDVEATINALRSAVRTLLAKPVNPLKKTLASRLKA